MLVLCLFAEWPLVGAASDAGSRDCHLGQGLSRVAFIPADRYLKKSYRTRGACPMHLGFPDGILDKTHDRPAPVKCGEIDLLELGLYTPAGVGHHLQFEIGQGVR
jgi:hypothetical protein